MVEVSGYLSYFDPAGNPQWYTLAIIIQTFALFIYGLIFAIGHALRMADLERWAKGEMLNTFATFFMVVWLVWLLQEIDSFSLTYFFGADPSTGVGPVFECGGETISILSMKDSLDLLKCRLATKAASLADIQSRLPGAAWFVLRMLTVYFSLIGLPIIQGNYFGPFFKEAETYRLINQTITVILISLNTLIVTVDYVKNNMLTFYLPVGLFLRSFHYTRGIGAFFIALAIGFYFIYPVLYIITDPGFVKPTFTPSPMVPTSNSCYPTFTSVIYSITESASSAVSSASGGVSLGELRNDISLIYSSILLRPFLVLAMTLIFVRYIMYVLGGEPIELMRALGKVL